MSKMLRDWPASQRPRERLFRQGVQVLSDAELLALFLRSGRRGESVHDLALRLLGSSDGLSGIARRSPQELLRIAGLGPAKVAALLASFEIGNRVDMERVERRPSIRSPKTLYSLVRRRLACEREEVLLALLLNAKNELMKIVTLSRGDPTRIVVSVPQVIRRLLMEGAAAVVFVHNHPSGDPTPSLEDEKLTRRLLKACVAVDMTMHDHLIVGSGRVEKARKFFSFAETGLL